MREREKERGLQVESVSGQTQPISKTLVNIFSRSTCMTKDSDPFVAEGRIGIRSQIFLCS